MSEKNWSLEAWLSKHRMDAKALEVVKNITEHITREQCVALGADIFAAEKFALGNNGTGDEDDDGTMCIGTDIFAIFPFTIIDSKEEKNYLIIFFSYREDGTMWLSDSAKCFGLISENDFKHRYSISPTLDHLPNPRLEAYEILTPEQLKSIGMESVSN